MKKILITGGAGFIGSHLIDELLMKGNNIIAVDNFNAYYDPSIKEKNIMEIKKNMKKRNISENYFKLYKIDIRDENAMEKIFKENDIDVIVHLAAMAGVRPSLEKPKLYYDVNINGTLNLLELSRKYNINKFLFASSSSVYGNNAKIPFSEKDSVDKPISPYAATKKSGELLCHTYHHLYNINVACLRFFTVYGPRQRPDLAIHKFAKLIMEGKPIPFYGDGTSERDYTYIDDIIDGITKTIGWLGKVDSQYEIFNLGESKTISLRDMVATIEGELGIEAKLKMLPMQPGDVKRTYAKTEKAKDILGYSPQKEFKDGIFEFIKWIKN